MPECPALFKMEHTIKEAFATWMEANGFGTINESIYYTNAPLGVDGDVYWLVSAGGNSISKNTSGEKQKNYIIEVYHRGQNARSVEVNMQSLEEQLNSAGCITIPGYDIIEVEATGFSSDQDLDEQDKQISLVQVTLTVYK